MAAAFVSLLRCIIGLGLAKSFRKQSQFEFEFLAPQIVGLLVIAIAILLLVANNPGGRS